MSRNQNWGLWIGAGLIGLGVLFLLGQFLQVNIMRFLWPLFILAFGAAFFVGMFAGGRALGALAVPGSVITTIGLILFFQNLFGLWASWAYAWALIISGAGIGLMIFGSWSGFPDLRRAGRAVVIIGLILFFIFGLFFELGAGLLGMRSPGGIFWAAALILVGLYVLFGRSLLNQASGPVSRSVTDFSSPSGGAAVYSAPGGDSPSVVEASASATAQGVTETPASGIRRINFRSLGDMTIIQGEREGLEIEAPEVARERIRSEVLGDTLEIRYEQNWLDWLNPRFWNISTIRYTLYVRELESLRAAGLGNITIPALAARRFELIMSGTGNVHLRRFEAESLVVNQSGLGTVDIEGRVERQEVELSGAGSYHAGRLDSQSASVRLSGLGSANVRVNESLDAHVTGTGSIDYSGSARVSQQVTGLGSVRRIG